MGTVSLRVGSLENSLNDFRSAWTGDRSSEPSISFASWEVMHRILTPKRLEIIRALCGQLPMSIREVSRRVGRDFKGVHTDVSALVKSGLVEQEGGKICFPYDRIRVEFDIDAAA